METLSFFSGTIAGLELLDKIYICNMVLKIISYNIANVKCSCFVSYVIVYVRRNKNRFYLVTKRNALKLIYVRDRSFFTSEAGLVGFGVGGGGGIRKKTAFEGGPSQKN